MAQATAQFDSATLKQLLVTGVLAIACTTAAVMLPDTGRTIDLVAKLALMGVVAAASVAAALILARSMRRPPTPLTVAQRTTAPSAPTEEPVLVHYS